MTTSEAIKHIREHYHISQNDLSDLLNASVRTIQHWEQGDYEPHGTAVRLIQLLTKNDEIFAELKSMKGAERIMYLDHDNEARTIMGIQFQNDEEYQSSLNAIINNMYDGWQPTLDDIQMAHDFYISGPLNIQEILRRVRARGAVSTNEKLE